MQLQVTPRPVARHVALAAVALATVPANLALGVDWRLALAAGAAVLAFGELSPRLLPRRPAPPDSRLTGVQPLSHSEGEVAILATQGLSSREIATRRFRSVRTVERQIDSIYTKLDIHSRAELAVWVMERGLLPRTDGKNQPAQSDGPNTDRTRPPRL